MATAALGGAHAYEDGAPPAHDGGHGAATCAACHSDNSVNAQPGRISIEGLPERATPGQVFAVRVSLKHPELGSGGLQLSLRGADGMSAGQLEPADGRTSILSADGVDYLQHTRAGVRSDANDDRSALGDYVYTLSREIVIGDR